MKQLPVCLTIVLVCFFSISQAQEKIEYDFSQNTLTKPAQKLKEGSSVILQYKMVNKYALKSGASMTSGNRTYDDGLSQLQAGIQVLAGESKKVEGEAAQTKTGLAEPHLTDARQTALEKLDEYLGTKKIILENIVREFNYISDEIQKVNSIMSMDKDVIAATNDYTLNTQLLIDETIFLQSNSSGVSAPADFSSGLNASISIIRLALGNIDGWTIALRNNFQAATDLSAEQRKEESPRVDEIISEVKKRTTAIETTYSGQNLKTLQENAADMARRSQKLLSQDFTISPTVVGNADGDYIEISDKLLDNDGKQVFEIKPFKIQTYGGSRIDFSVGLAVNIGGHGEFSYDLRKNPTNATSGTAVDSVILLQNDENRLFKLSPSIFVHWYRNSEKNNLQWMLTTGLTPNFTDLSDSRLSIGTSLGFPSSNNLARRIVLTAGMSLGYADVLKTKYKDLVDFRSFGDLDAADLTEKALKIGAFFSISYNLGGIGH